MIVDWTKEKCIKTLTGHTNYVWTVVKINENIIASGSRDSSIKIWSLNAGNCINTLIKQESAIFCIIKFNDVQIVSGSRDYTIKTWDIMVNILNSY